MSQHQTLPDPHDPRGVHRLPSPWFRATCLWLCALMVVASSQAEDAESEVRLDPVQVTGTRLKTLLSDGAYPLTTITRDQIVDSGQQTMGEFLQELPFVSGSPLNTSTSLRGEGGGQSRGIATLELRGLGPERTLVLLNGRRIVSGGNGASGVVDLSMIPVSIVDRVEIFKSGASVEYGADAVAGVVNIITRKTVEGLELDLQGSRTTDGDAGDVHLSAVFGRSMGPGHWVMGLDYVDQPSVSKGARAFSRQLLTVEGPNNEIVPGGSSAPPQGNFRTSLGRLILIDGENGDSLDDFRPFVGDGANSDRYNFNPFEDLQQASERFSAYLQGDLAITPMMNLRTELFYHQRDSSQQLAPLPLFTNRLADVRVAADQLYNPFGEPLDDVRRRLVEAGPRTFSQDNEAYRAVLALDGMVSGWFWDAAINYGRNRTDQRKTGDLLADRVRQALGPSFIDSSGQAVCGTAAAVIVDCVPLNLFSGAGTVSPQMIDYVATDLNDRGFNEQRVASANVTGDLFDLPAGIVAAAFGLEYRDERAADTPDLQIQLGNTTGSARSPTRGRYDSTEFYSEFNLPLLRDLPYARDLSLDLGARHVDFSNAGSRWLTEAGLHYEPLESLQFRLSYSEAFRAPNVRELFGGVAQSNPIVEDPCADFAQLSAEQIDRCIAQGVPADGSFDQNGQETPQLGGGNPDLDAETARVLTAGIQFQPQWLEGLLINLDYYDIDIQNGILALGAETILSQCLLTGQPVFCQRIARDGEGNLTSVSAQLQNIADESAQGLDLDVSYGHDAWEGRMEHGLLLSYVTERNLVAFPGAAPFAGAGGYDADTFGAIPRWRGSYRLAWARGNWGLGYDAQWIGSVTERGGELFPGTGNPVSDQVYHDLSARYRFSDRLSLAAGIDNLTDEQPPFFANADEANTDVSTYRVLGSSYWLRISYRL